MGKSRDRGGLGETWDGEELCRGILSWREAPEADIKPVIVLRVRQASGMVGSSEGLGIREGSLS